MGVAGAGKTTVGKKLAELLGCPFYEGDDFHPSSNIEKMEKGKPLTDEDREPWLILLREQIKSWRHQNPLFVLTCSALKEKYRKILESGGPVRWVYLKCEFDLISDRLSKRERHFFPPCLLESQFQDLEEPNNALEVENILPADRIAAYIRDQLDRVE